ncbi:ribosome biogenesis GTPase Der [Candidatus Mycoplasma mahonii]|uniref:ribosome biogenesis GTPase Der n=1 Tax=Candidatus Mycoplasma mahonii TaxID=3004105 RepID=UPI0026EDBCC3|nr:ribosome biogenesis GTPase Der [Candidatus Mycoplasma mahonii]WKX02618.1 ribosome biogenesis GTPase Der [Candidatus Mycoplasma mahonii]
MDNLVAIVGRPNVGKSTLFNKLIGKRVSIVHDQPGITRDRLYHDAEWIGKNFKIIDTGGITIGKDDFQEDIVIQARIAIEESKLIILVVDGLVGLTFADQFVISLIRKSKKKVLLAVNKLEGNKDMDPSIYSSGLKDIFQISAIHGEGVGDLLDEVASNLDDIVEDDQKINRLAIIGRPNAGKSSLLNSLAGKERSIVSEISGTTRDSVSSIIDINGENFKVIDTAGISKKSKLIESVDHYALARAFSSLENAHVTLLIIDVTLELSHFDARLAGYAMEKQKPIIIVINKWDLIQKDVMTMKNFEKKIRKEFKFMSWAPIVFISAIKSDRLSSLKDIIIIVKENIRKKVKTSLLNEMIMDIQAMQPAPSFKGGRLNIAFAKQVESSIPKFILFVNNEKYLHFSYKRYIENQFREYFGFLGTPIKIVLRNKKG